MHKRLSCGMHCNYHGRAIPVRNPQSFWCKNHKSYPKSSPQLSVAMISLWNQIRDYFLPKTTAIFLISPQKYRIRPNYCTYSYKRTVKRFHSLKITGSVLFCLLLYKGICCGYSFELHRLVDAIQMSTHNICVYKENQKKLHNQYQISPFLIFIFFYSVPLAGTYFNTNECSQ